MPKFFQVTTIVLCLVLAHCSVYAQDGVLLDYDPIPPARSSSAVFEARSTDQGMLVPRVALSLGTGNAAPVTSPATSLLVYNTAAIVDVTPGYYYWNGTAWVRLMSSNNTPTASGATNKVAFWTSNTNLGNNTNFHWDNSGNGKLGIGTASPTANYLLTLNAHGTNSQRGAIDITMTSPGANATGINITSAAQQSRGIMVANSSTGLTNPFWAVGGELSSTRIVSGYLGYRTGSGLSYGLYGVNGTNGTYTTDANTWAAFLQGRTVISSETSPTSPLGVDLEVRNTTTGAAAPATVSLRQTTALATSGNIMADINFGDNRVTSAQARIRALRDAASGSAADMPTALSFWTTPDASATLTERLRITSNGNVGIGTTIPGYKFEVVGNINATTNVRAAGTLTNGGFDFYLGNTDQTTRGNSGSSRALVKDAGNILTLNYGGDFTGGTRIGSLAGTGTRFVVADANGTLTATSATTAGVVTGAGTTNYLGRWTTANTLGNGATQDNGTEVGIGIAPGAFKLNVNGTTQSSLYYVNHGIGNVLEVGDDAWIADVNMANTVGITGNQTGSNGGLRLGTNTAAYFYSNGTANIGVGTTTPGNKLSINGGADPWPVRVQNSSGYIDFGPANASYAHIYTDRPTFYLNKGLYTGAGNALLNASTGNSYVNAGNFGVGNTAPTHKLHVTGDIWAEGRYVVQNGTDGGTTRGIRMWTAGDSNWGIYMSTSGAGKSLAGGTVLAGGGISSHAIRFRSYNTAANGFVFENSSEQNLFSISGTGRAYFRGGVQFDCPACGDVSNIDGTSNWGNLTIQGRVISTNSNLHLSPPSGSGVYINTAYRAAGGSAGTTSGLWVDDQTKMMYTNVGQFQGAAGFAFAGSGVLLENQFSESGGFQANGDNANIWSPGDADLVRFYDEDGMVLKTVFNGNGTYSNPSDRNKKQNIVKVTGALEKILTLSGYNYEFKLHPEEVEKGQKPELTAGVIAQEVQAVMPELVSEIEDQGLFMNYDGLFPYLIEALKELTAKVENQQKQIDELLIKSR